jgi:hypothetical protein
VLAGVVVRSDRIVDGMVFGRATVRGDDATDAVIGMFGRLGRSDINVIMLGGTIISLFNIIDVDRLRKETGVPIVGVTFEASPGIEADLRRAFPRRWRAKVRAYRKLGRRVRVLLKTGKHVYARFSGLNAGEGTRLMDKFTLQGALPEPIRLAKLAARAKYEANRASRSRER